MADPFKQIYTSLLIHCVPVTKGRCHYGGNARGVTFYCEKKKKEGGEKKGRRF